MFSRREFIAGATAALAAACTSGEESGTTIAPTPTTARATTTTLALLDPIVAPSIDNADPSFFGLGVASGDPDTHSVVLWTRLAGDLVQDVPLVWELTLPEIEDFSRLLATGLVTTAATEAHSVHAIADGLQPDRAYIYRFRVGDVTSPVGRTRTMPIDDSEVTLGVSSCQRREDGFWQVHDDIAASDLNLMIWLGDYVYRTTDATTPDHAGYRQLHEQYRRDPSLQAAHASCPWFMGIDDNDVLNDFTAVSATIPGQKAAALLAWWEHQPTRLAKPTGSTLEVYRHLDVGTLARITMFGARQFSEPGAKLVGEAQREWFESVVESPHAWTFVASPVLVSELVPGSPDLVPYAWPAFVEAQQWLKGQLQRASRPIVLSGDLHTALATSVVDAAGLPLAPELMAPAISSRFPEELADVVPLLPFVNPLVQHVDPRQGWLKLTVTADQVEAEFRATDAQIEGDPVVTGAKYLISSDGLLGPAE